jgi:hypothetical protein
MNVEYSEDMRVIGKVRISLKELHFGDNEIRIPVHTNIPLAGNFDIVLTDFRSQGTLAMLRMDHVGVIPSPLTSVLGPMVSALFGKVLSKATVSVNGNQMTVDFSGYLPIPLRDIHVTSLAIRDGMEITFDY